jgi:hypothetical protein
VCAWVGVWDSFHTYSRALGSAGTKESASARICMSTHACPPTQMHAHTPCLSHLPSHCPFIPRLLHTPLTRFCAFRKASSCVHRQRTSTPAGRFALQPWLSQSHAMELCFSPWSCTHWDWCLDCMEVGGQVVISAQTSPWSSPGGSHFSSFRSQAGLGRAECHLLGRCFKSWALAPPCCLCPLTW